MVRLIAVCRLGKQLSTMLNAYRFVFTNGYSSAN